eukprot:4438632-Amphidinium_carterae.1
MHGPRGHFGASGDVGDAFSSNSPLFPMVAGSPYTAQGFIATLDRLGEQIGVEPRNSRGTPKWG